jgi:trehalose 6-phosphate phosphatase
VTEPGELATLIAGRPRPVLLGLDVDGTLAPIVLRPEDAALSPGAVVALRRLSGAEGLAVVVVSGRPLRDLTDVFGLPAEIRLVGSHGLEDSAGAGLVLDAEERSRLDEARALAEEAAAGAPGTWLEDKPASVVLHVRPAEGAAGDAALAAFAAGVAHHGGLHLLSGHRVLEVAVRPLSKAAAVGRLRRETAARTVAYLGDDVTDEEVITRLGAGDVGIRVGSDESVAPHRLAGPPQVVAMLDALADRWPVAAVTA